MNKAKKTNEVRAFFDRWQIYQKLVSNNYHSHRQAYRILRSQFVRRFPKDGFSLFDLGCGDAGFMIKLLRGTRVKQYTGVDISSVALGLAKKNTRELACRKRFVCADLSKEIGRVRNVDIIWVGLSLHHLRQKQKAEFFAKCKKALAPGGCFICYEPFLREGESRRDFLKRWLSWGAKCWKALTREENLLHNRHIRQGDFPEAFSTYKRLARQAGFTRARSLFTGGAGYLKLMMFE